MVSVVRRPSAQSANSLQVSGRDASLGAVWRKACASVSFDDPAGNSVEYVVDVRLDSGRGAGVQTRYEARVHTQGLPSFTVTNRKGRVGKPVSSADSFAEAVSVKTNDADRIGDYLTAERRTAIADLLAHADGVEVTNSKVTAWTPGIERDSAAASLTMHYVLEAADALRPCWADALPLDEGAVVDDLFHSNLDTAGIEARFMDLYRGNRVNWTGEVLTVGATDRVGQRVAVLVGNTNESSSGHRVVVLTAINPAMSLGEGDIIGVSGTLLALNASKRLFTIE